MYIPHKRDIISINFDPSSGHEIRKRRPALVISNSKYSKLTDLVFVCPITHTEHNYLVKYGLLIKIDSINSNVNGFVNPLQCHTFDYKYRQVKFIDKMKKENFSKVVRCIKYIINADEK
ncbi:transcriptional regulator [Philodulcilactobacillus myokoensis]|uniref:Transcriptional regulator n=1 Tax=Philodulcilactobacillus myokoensis TaxID=2929573 RepID=A0A9W6ER68_9LACO|nr:type II toxin-antitoxin system PemK/MazF family toxin [Philodulcilactobacillus myokoensis]GLB46040.1 transcriptional regulator [Philodulcilactobacillus myokoensis]